MSLSRPAYTLRTPRILANSPYARGLWLALAGNHYDLARRKFIERYGLSLTPTVGGVGVRAPNVYTDYMVAGTPPVSANASMLAVFVPNATVGNESLLDADDASGVRNFQFRTSGATLQLIGFNTAKNSFTATTGTLFSKAGDLCVAIGVLNGTEVVARGRSGTTVVSATATMTGVPSGIGGRVVEVIGRAAADTAQASNHTLLLAAMWRRALSDDEQQRLLDDPWQILQRSRRVVYSLPTGDLAVNLLGQSSTFSYGTLVPALSRALSGLSASFSGGTLTPALAKTLTGQSATFSGGTLTPVTGITVNLTGQSFTGSTGSLKADLAISLLGQAVTASGGTLSPSVGGNVSVNLSGISGTFSYGTLTAGQGLPPETIEFSWANKKAKFSFKARYINFDLD